MGTSTILDIISSTIVAGLLFIMALRLNMQANETSAIYHSNLILQQNMTTLVGIVEHDFRRIGYCYDYTQIPEPSLAIRKADTSEFRFRTDIDNDGNVDSVQYYLGELDTTTYNPNDRILYRQVNNSAAQPMNMGVVSFRLRYLNVEGDTLTCPVPDPREVYSIEINLSVESPAPFQTEYTQESAAQADFQQFWRQLRLAARNLRNR